MKNILKMVPVLFAGVALALPASADNLPARKWQAPESNYKAAAVKAPATRASETWKDLGTGRLRDDMLTFWYDFNDWYEFDVQVQESEQTPGRYRLVNAYKHCPIMFDGMADKDRYIVVDASDPEHCYIEYGSTGLIINSRDSEGKEFPAEFCLWSVAEDVYNNTYGDWEDVEKYEGHVAGKLSHGAITFPRAQVLICMIESELVQSTYPGNQLWSRANADEMFRLSLPGAPELDAVLEYKGINDAKTEVSYTVALDKDVTKAKVALIPGEFTDQMLSEVADGTIASQELTASATLKFPYTADGVYTLVVLPYYGEELAVPFHLTTEYNYSEAEWRKCGLAQYTEAIMCSNEMTNFGSYSLPSYTYSVEVEESVAKPGLLRLVDPYGLDIYPVATQSNYDTSRHYYMVIDCQDPQRVFIPRTEGGIGLRYANLGLTEIWSRADRQLTEMGMTYQEIEAQNNFGKVQGDEITFPASSLYIMFPERTTNIYQANANGQFKVVLPKNAITAHDPVPPTTTVGIDGVDAEAQPARYYSIDGVQLAGEPAHGLYIKVQGTKATKIVK